MKKIYFLSLFFMTAMAGIEPLYAQEVNKVDSLKKELSTGSNPNKFGVLWGLAYELFDVDNPQALIYAKQAYDVALRNGDSLEIVKSGRIVGQLLRRVDKVDESIQILSRVLPVAKRHNFEREIKFTFNALATAHTFKAEYDKALKYHFQSLVIREKEGDKKQISITLANIGLVYFMLENFDLALEYSLLALKAKEEVNYYYDLDRLLINIGLCYNELNDFENAKGYLKKAYESCTPSCSSQIIIEGELGLGSIFLKEKNFNVARDHLKKSLDLSMQESNQRYQLENLVELTKLSIIQHDLISAKLYLKQAEAVPNKNSYSKLLLRLYRLNADVYTALNDFKKASFFHGKFSALNDIIFAAEVNKNLMKVQTQFAERENLSKIESQSKILLLQYEAIQRQQLLNLAVGAVALLTIGLVMVLYKINRQKQQINEILDLRVKERTSELERNRDELRHSHDEQSMALKRVSSNLTASLATLKGLSNAAAKDLPLEQAIYFKEAEATAERMVNYLKNYSARE